MSRDKINLGEEFRPEKTNDLFIHVEFVYENSFWKGAVPLYLDTQGFDIRQSIVNIKSFYDEINPLKTDEWIRDKEKYFSTRIKGQTYKVLNALLSRNWECRVCGPVAKINPQPAARIRDLKKYGFTIASQRTFCEHCSKKQMFDLLVMIARFEHKHLLGSKLRKPISQRLATRIKSVLRYKDTCFDSIKTSKELVIDHKFPSQRWSSPESDNNDDMTEQEIKNKFQLLTNQTNMLKSRICDRCVVSGKRGDFMGIHWFFKGHSRWEGDIKDNPKGCEGCPWHDLALWKRKLLGSLV